MPKLNGERCMANDERPGDGRDTGQKGMAMNRRDFLQAAFAAAAAGRTAPLVAASTRQTGVAGANERIRVGLIGCGNRGNQVAGDWMKHPDSVFVAACDVAKDRLEKTSAKLGAAQGNTVDGY